MAELRAEYERRYEEAIEELNIAHAADLAAVDSEKVRLQSKYEAAEARAEAAERELEAKTEALKLAQAASSRAERVLEFTALWRERFESLQAYAKAMEAAADKLGIDAVEPRTMEYLRSMHDVLRYCAEELKHTQL